MRLANRHVFLILLAAALALPAITSGCAERRSYRVYDPYYRDYHRWSVGEDDYYRRWEAERRREHRDLRQRGDDERREYWNWRHRHGDRDHDSDHDRDRKQDRDHDHDRGVGLPWQTRMTAWC